MSLPRQRWIDIARGVSVVAVVVVHVDAWTSRHHASELGSAASVALAVLFLLSGTVARHDVAAGDARRLVRRITGLLWLYAAWSPLVVLYRVIERFDEGRLDLGGELGRLLASPLRPNGELWYLWALAIHLVLGFVTRRAPAPIVLVPLGLVFVVVQGWGQTLVGPQVWHVLGPGLQGLPQFAFLTLLGLRGALPVRRIGAMPIWSAALVATVSGSLLVVLVSMPGHPVLLPLLTLVGAAAVLATARAVADLPGARRAAVLGQISLAPYLMHTAVIAIVVVASRHLGFTLPDVAPRILVLATVTALAVLVPVVVFLAVQRCPLRYAFHAPPWCGSVPARLLEVVRR